MSLQHYEEDYEDPEEERSFLESPVFCSACSKQPRSHDLHWDLFTGEPLCAGCYDERNNQDALERS